MAASDLLAIALHLLQLYAALAVMVIGFVIMIGGATRSGRMVPFGTSWAGSVARFLFLRPIAVLAGGIAAVLATVFVHGGRLALRIGKAILSSVVDPLILVIIKVVRAILFPRRR